MTLAQIHIDAQTLEEAPPARRLEWEANVREILDPAELVAREDAGALHVTVTQEGYLLELDGVDGARLATVEIANDELADVVREYVDVVRQMASTDGAAGLTRLEALDMAKKVTHDRAGRILKRRCKDLGIDHATARRLFTLLLSLRVDTTRLDGVHGHRRVR